MKNTFLLGILLLACTACGSGRTPSTAPATAPAEAPLAGGYAAPRQLTPEEKALFETVTAGLQGVAYDPQSVQTQVVAGTNYRFRCKAHTLQGALHTYEAEITVFVPLPGRGGAPEITSIVKVNEKP